MACFFKRGGVVGRTSARDSQNMLMLMKTLKYLWSLVFFFTLAFLQGQAKGEDRVVLNVVENTDTTIWDVAVVFDNGRSGNYTAFQMDLVLPNGFVVNDNSWVTGARMSGHRLSVERLSGSKYRILAFSASNAEIEGRTGELLHLKVGNVVREVPRQGYTLKLSNVIFTKRDGVEVRDVSSSNAQMFSLSYVLDGSLYAYEVVQEGTALQAPVPTPNEGYLFKGWQELPTTMPGHNLTIYGNTEPTGISSLTADEMVEVYTLDGRCCAQGMPWAKVKPFLQSGVYLVNGRKVMVR